MSTALGTICWQEFTLHRRNRWVVFFAGLFAVLTLAIAWFGMVTSGYAGFQDFTRTAASIVNLGAFLIPLLALLLGVFSFLSAPEYLELLVTQPISRSRLLLGKFLGLLLTVLSASLLGFGLPGVVISLVIGVQGAADYLLVVLYSCLLATVFTGLSMLIALIGRRRQVALGVALGVWVFYELVYGLLMLGATLVFADRVLEVLLLGGLLGNPIDTTRVLSLLAVGGPHLFGPAGATLVKMTGSLALATLFGLVGLAAWVVLPLLASMRIFERQNL